MINKKSEVVKPDPEIFTYSEENIFTFFRGFLN